ncbi:MAG: hypothetical protein DRQ46_00145 [Gammaproteobacteria bacterium]|nr:MAG: hypothetical protein DRQ46_00145 [Gammaproteobacteria bacterium]
MAISGIEGLPTRPHPIVSRVTQKPAEPKRASLEQTIKGGPRHNPPMPTVGSLEKCIGQSIDILA